MPAINQEISGALLAVLAGLAYFVLLMSVSQGLAAVNASVTPGIPWFPVPALLLIGLVTRWVAGRWPLRLSQPRREPRWPLYAFAVLATFAAMCLAILEGARHGLTRTAPGWPGDVPALFNWVFLFTLPLIASVLAEVGFRGIMQTALEKIMPLWPMLLMLAILNALFHFYDPEQSSQWLRFISLNLVFGYITWYAQSILPALAAHIGMNIVEPLAERVYGPVALGSLTGSMLTGIGIIGCAALAVGVVLLKKTE